MRRRAASWATELAAIQSVDAASAVDKACLSVLFADAEPEGDFAFFSAQVAFVVSETSGFDFVAFPGKLNIAHMPARI